MEGIVFLERKERRSEDKYSQRKYVANKEQDKGRGNEDKVEWRQKRQ